MEKFCFAVFAALAAAFTTTIQAETWNIEHGDNPDSPGNMVLISHEGKPIARFVHGPRQMKPFLHLYGDNGELLTNGGLDKEGNPTGLFPHHRGIFIGWKITSDLGTYDLWHMNNGGKMEALDIETAAASEDSAAIVAKVAWRGGKTDGAGNDLLLTEKRTLIISRPHGKYTQVEGRFELTPARDLKLAGDLQHSGVHFRASNEVASRTNETSYLLEPEGVVKGNNLKWCRLGFPIGKEWYAATQFNAPSNPVEELSTRDYGRFGYFFKHDLKKGEPLTLSYRFIIEHLKAAPSKDDSATRKIIAAEYAAFAK